MKKKLLAFGMAVLMLTGCGSSSGTIRFGAAGLGGTYHMFSDAFAEIIESESADCSIEVKTTAGSAANVRLLSDGYVQMAIAQADIINDAYYGVGMFENDKKYQGYSAVGGLYTEACQIVVRADSDIRSVEDLQGKTVSVGEEESGTEKNAEQILAAYGLSERLVTEVNLDYTDAVEQLKKKEIDAMFCTAGAYTTVIGELAKQCEIRFIDLDEKGIDKLMKSYDFYTECEIPENTYVGQTEAVRTVGVKAVLLASDKLSEKKVKEITEILFENKAELQYILPTDISLDESQATEGITIPFHDGAAVYYEEHGISMNDGRNRMKIQLDMYQTIAVAVVVLMLGKFLKKRCSVLERFCIPAPVIGGVLFAIFTCICYATGIAEFEFDDILKEVCMVFFFTSVGFQANLKVLKSGGKSLIVFLGLVVVLIVTQNFMAIGLSKLLHISPLVGLCTGSIPMVGGHGTAGAFGPVLEDFGVKGASTLCTAGATFGLIAGSMIGGPIGKRLIEKKNLLSTAIVEDDSLLVEEEKKHERHTSMYPSAVFQLIIAIGIGTIVSYFLSMTGLTFPIYIGAMIAAAVIRNVGEYSGKFTIYMGEINDIGGISLSLFL